MERITQNSLHICFYCGRECSRDPNRYPFPGVRKLHVDHFIPLAVGGAEDETNYRISCAPCNLAKSDKMPEDHARASYAVFLASLYKLKWKFGHDGISEIRTLASKIAPGLTPF